MPDLSASQTTGAADRGNVGHWLRTSSLGRITAADIKALSPDLPHQDILMCGPSAMVHNLTQQFLAVGVAAERIHFEDVAAMSR